VERNKYGVRLSVGTRDLDLLNNVVRASDQYALYAYRGSDSPAYTGTSGRPIRNLIKDNTFDGAGSNVVKLSDTDQTEFSGNTITGTVGNVNLARAAGTRWNANSVPTSLVFGESGSSSQTFADVDRSTKIKVDASSATDFVNSDGRLLTVSNSSASSRVTASAATLRLTSATIGTSGSTVVPSQLYVVPAGSAVNARITGWGAGGGHLLVKADSSPLSVKYKITQLTPGAIVTVRVNSQVVAKGTADTSGVFRFDDSALGTSERDYTISW